MEFVFEHATMIAVIAVVVIILAILASGYVKAPPDTAFIISGFQKGQRILIGNRGLRADQMPGGTFQYLSSARPHRGQTDPRSWRTP